LILGFTSEKPFKRKLETYRKQRKAEVDFRVSTRESDMDALTNENWTLLDTPNEHREWFLGWCSTIYFYISTLSTYFK
jgi:hypothetical protein